MGFPGDARINLTRSQRGRHIALRHADEGHIGISEAVFLENVFEEELRNRTEVDADFLALEVGNRSDTGIGDDTISAGQFIEREDGLEGSLRVAILGKRIEGGREAVQLTARHRCEAVGGVFDVGQGDVEAVIGEIAFFLGDEPGAVADPDGIAQIQLDRIARLRGGARCADQRD